jgi:hypothetical protein
MVSVTAYASHRGVEAVRARPDVQSDLTKSAVQGWRASESLHGAISSRMYMASFTMVKRLKAECHAVSQSSRVVHDLEEGKHN